MTSNNPFASADSKDAATPNTMSGGGRVLPGSGTYKVTDVKLVDNSRESKMFHVWEFDCIESDNPDQQKVCSILCRIQPDPYLFGIKDAKSLAAAALGASFEDIDSSILASSTNDKGKEAFVGAVVKIDAMTVTTKTTGKEFTKYKFEHVAPAPEVPPAAEDRSPQAPPPGPGRVVAPTHLEHDRLRNDQIQTQRR